MSDRHILIANPPHAAHDLVEVASLFGLTAAEVRMKVNYQIPEIWFEDTDIPNLERKLETLSAVGLNTVLTRASDLNEVPDQTPVQSFEFGKDSLELRCEETAIGIPYDAPTVMVHCQPKHGAGFSELKIGANALGNRLSHTNIIVGESGRHSAVFDMLEKSTAGELYEQFFDFYVSSGSNPLRYSILASVVDFSSLGEPLPTAAANMAMFAAECRDRFTTADIDERLLGMRTRDQTVSGPIDPKTGKRKGFSFATPALSKLLREIAPALDQITQADYCSRMVYLTKRVN